MKLSEKWIEYLIDQPEYGMGYQKAKVTLKDGTSHNVTIVNCSVILSADGTIGKCPFSDEQIDKIKVFQRGECQEEEK